jgi:hypothetical protein
MEKKRKKGIKWVGGERGRRHKERGRDEEEGEDKG